MLLFFAGEQLFFPGVVFGEAVVEIAEEVFDVAGVGDLYLGQSFEIAAVFGSDFAFGALGARRFGLAFAFDIPGAAVFVEQAVFLEIPKPIPIAVLLLGFGALGGLGAFEAKAFEGTGDELVREVENVAQTVWIGAFHKHTCVTIAVGEDHLVNEKGTGAGDLGHGFGGGDDFPVFVEVDAVLHDEHVGVYPEDFIAEFFLKAGGDGEGRKQGRDAEGHAGHGDECDHGDGLPLL